MVDHTGTLPSVRTVGVVGCGVMGSGVAHVVARAGYTTIVREVDAALLAGGRRRITASLASGGKLDPLQRGVVESRLSFTTDLADLAPCDVVIEAAVEALEVKQAIFRDLDRLCATDAVLASNTSSIPIASLAGVTGHPERVVGLHFFNPVPVMRLVEIVHPASAGEDALNRAQAFIASLDKRAILVKDRAGFVVNVLLIPYILDAIRLLEQDVASMEDVDAAMKLGCGHPMGPLELADFIGLDTTLSIADVLVAELGEQRYAAPTMLRQMVLSGLYGRKSGRGFYAYPAAAPGQG